jgi:uncharacterized paraquat-inducible protein A
MNYNEFECPNCDEIVNVPVPYAAHVVCPGCKLTLEIHPDADQDENGWHDRTTLSIAAKQNDSRAILEAARA